MTGAPSITGITTAAAPPAEGPVPVRVVLVDDCEDVRFLLATLMELDGRFDVVGEADDAASALASVAANDPDVVLVDLRLGRRSGTSLIRDLHRRGAKACIVVVTASVSPEDHAAAFAAGAHAVQVKGTMISTMVDDLADLVERHASGFRRCDTPAAGSEVTVTAAAR